jgi:hypothetical protein
MSHPYQSGTLERFRHDGRRADALEAVIRTTAGHLLDDLDKDRSLKIYTRY